MRFNHISCGSTYWGQKGQQNQVRPLRMFWKIFKLRFLIEFRNFVWPFLFVLRAAFLPDLIAPVDGAERDSYWNFLACSNQNSTADHLSLVVFILPINSLIVCDSQWNAYPTDRNLIDGIFWSDNPIFFGPWCLTLAIPFKTIPKVRLVLWSSMSETWQKIKR